MLPLLSSGYNVTGQHPTSASTSALPATQPSGYCPSGTVSQNTLPLVAFVRVFYDSNRKTKQDKSGINSVNRGARVLLRSSVVDHSCNPAVGRLRPGDGKVEALRPRLTENRLERLGMNLS